MIKRLTALMFALALSAPAYATVLKIATVAPEGSTWMNLMRAGAATVAERSEGRVQLKFYTGGVMGNEKKVLRKMRVGQLDGGAFTASGLSERYPELAVYGLPLLFESPAEVAFVRSKMDSVLYQGLHDAGLVALGFAGGGFAKIMSNTPVRSLDDLKGRKIWVPEGDRLSYNAMQALGLAPVVLPLTDVLTGLQTGLIDIVASSPVGALVLQWHTKVKYITDLPLAYVMGTMVVERKSFETLDAADQQLLRETMGDIYRKLDEAAGPENANAEAALIANGIERVAPAEAQVREWRRIVSETNLRGARAGAFDPQLLVQLEQYLGDYRSTAEQRSAAN